MNAVAKDYPIPREVKAIRLDVPSQGVETKIVIYAVNARAHIGMIYRRRGGEMDWTTVGRTEEAGSAANAEKLARDWHRDNLRAKANA